MPFRCRARSCRILSETAVLLDIDGTLLDLAPTPREVWVPPGLAKTLHRLHQRTNGALALVSGRSLNDIDLIFAPDQFPAVGGHGAEMRLEADSEAVGGACAADGQGIEAAARGDRAAQPGNTAGRQGLFAGAALSPRAACGEGDLCGGVADPRRSAQRADRGAARKAVCEIKHSGFTKATGVRELMTHEPFKGRRPLFIGDDVTDESVFAIMPDLDGLAFSVGRRARGVAGHFDAPSDVREFLAHLLDDEREILAP